MTWRHYVYLVIGMFVAAWVTIGTVQGATYLDARVKNAIRAMEGANNHE